MIPVVTMPYREGVENVPVQPPEVSEPSPSTGSDSSIGANSETDTVPFGAISQAQLDAAQARATYRRSIIENNPLTDRALGALFARSRTWGAARKDEVHAAIADGLDPAGPSPTEPAPAEPVPASDAGPVVETQPGPEHGRVPSTYQDREPVPELGPATKTTLPLPSPSDDARGGPHPVPSPVSMPAGTDVPVERHGMGGAPAVVWFALLLGIAVSIAANVMSTQLTSDEPAAWIGSAFWPIALLLSLEIVTRVPWPRTALYVIARFLGVGLVAVVAAVLSYRHMVNLLLSWNEDPINAYLGPLAVDGLMLTAATAMLALYHAARPAPVRRVHQPRGQAKNQAAQETDTVRRDDR